MEVMFSCLHGKHFSDWAISPASATPFYWTSFQVQSMKFLKEMLVFFYFLPAVQKALSLCNDFLIGGNVMRYDRSWFPQWRWSGDLSSLYILKGRVVHVTPHSRQSISREECTACLADGPSYPWIMASLIYSRWKVGKVGLGGQEKTAVGLALWNISKKSPFP